MRSIEVAAHAGTVFDGEHLFQLAEDRILKIDPKSGRVLATIPAPGGGGDSRLTWREGTLWVGQHRDRKIHQVDPDTGAILRTIQSNRFVTGVTWVDGELWHGTWEGDESELRRVDPEIGDVLARVVVGLPRPLHYDRRGCRLRRRIGRRAVASGSVKSQTENRGAVQTHIDALIRRPYGRYGGKSLSAANCLWH